MKIKFRVFNNYSKLMLDENDIIDWNVYLHPTDGQLYIFDKPDYDRAVMEKDTRLIPMMYTGLNDIHDNEVYEGDIIKYVSFCRNIKAIGECIFKYGAFGVMYSIMDEQTSFIPLLEITSMEIIDNINNRSK